MRYLVDGEAIQSFLAVAEELNFRRAAERLHVDQSALSRRIQRLEAQVGFELFTRSTREVRLTEAGRVFYGESLRTVAQLQGAVENARRVAEGRTGHLRIGYMAFAALEAMPRAVRRFRQAHPDISVQITYIRTQGQKLALARGEIDVGFMIGPLDQEGFEALPVSDERLIAVLPIDHWLVTRPKLYLRDLAECEMILGDFAQWDFYRLLIADLFGAKGLTVRTSLEASSTLGILGLVSAGLGVSVYPEGLRRFQPRHVAMKDIEDCERRIETILAWRRDRSDPVVERFVACCREEFAG
jgi:DNA-binding transcriptional LysR family regulator